MPEPHAVAVVDDDDAVRLSTASFLIRAGFAASTFASGEELLLAGLQKGLRCILLDVRMPGLDGLSVLRELLQRELSPAVVMLTGHGDVALAVEAMKLGAFDFLEKPYDPQALLDVLRRAFAVPVFSIAKSVIDHADKMRIDSSSERQRAVLRGMLRGQANKIIAYELSLSTRTVEAYRAQMLAKLGVKGTSQAVKLALAAGMPAD